MGGCCSVNKEVGPLPSCLASLQVPKSSVMEGPTRSPQCCWLKLSLCIRFQEWNSRICARGEEPDLDFCSRSLTSQVVLVVKNSPTKAGDIRDMGLIPRSGRCPGGSHGNPFQYPCLENPMERGVWQTTVHRVTKSQTGLKQLPRTHTELSTGLLSLGVKKKKKEPRSGRKSYKMKLLTMIRSGEVRAAVWEDKEHHSETGVGMRDGKQRQQAVRKDQARSSEWGSAVRSGRGKLRKLFPQKNCLQTLTFMIFSKFYSFQNLWEIWYHIYL